MHKAKFIIWHLVLSYGILQNVAASDFWVSPGGNDANAGTPVKPFLTLEQAQRRVSDLCLNGGIPPGEPIKIVLDGGIYALSAPLVFDSENLGSATHPISIESAPGQSPVLSGGVEISGWKKSAGKIPGLPDAARGKIWVANVPRVNGKAIEFRQLWIGDKKAVRAREPGAENLSRLIGWDKTNQIAEIPASLLAGIKKPLGLEMVIDQVWEIAILRVKKIQITGDVASVQFDQPESQIEFEHPWPPVTVSSNYAAPFYLENAIQFLDSPGEWFEDLRAGKVYYWPRDGENLADEKVIAPVLETVVQVSGTLDQPVSHLRFQGITFANTTWLRPSESGHVPLQAGMFMLEAHKLIPRGTSYHPKLDNVAWIGRPPAAVSVEDANNISFEDCRFEHTASAGLDFRSGTHDDLVEGCIFHDIGGNGIQLGTFSDTNVEAHFPYNPHDSREVCTHETISNNLIYDCGTEDWGCVGICAGYVRGAQIEHNEVFNLPYSGISVGWGWAKATNVMADNLIFANRVHDVGQRLGDLGGIYTLSCQPGTVVAENSVSNMPPSQFVPDPKHWYYLYADEGSSHITFRDNWCPAEKFSRNANGPGNIWTNNGPQVSDKIESVAGLEPAFSQQLNAH